MITLEPVEQMEPMVVLTAPPSNIHHLNHEETAAFIKDNIDRLGLIVPLDWVKPLNPEMFIEDTMQSRMRIEINPSNYSMTSYREYEASIPMELHISFYRFILENPNLWQLRFDGTECDYQITCERVCKKTKKNKVLTLSFKHDMDKGEIEAKVNYLKPMN